MLLGRGRLTPATALAFCDGGYTTNLPVADLLGGQAWLAFGSAASRSSAEHGGPARLLVPHLYFWKSASGCAGSDSRDDRRAWLLGIERLPHLRRPMAGTAVLRATDLARPPRCGTVWSGDCSRVRTAAAATPDWPGHRAGQHVDVRLTAEDGYQAERSYSIASAPGEPLARSPSERLDDGEVLASPDGGGAARGPVRGARADRRLLRLGAKRHQAVRRCSRRAARGVGAAAGHPAAASRGQGSAVPAGPAAALLAQLERRDLLQRARRPPDGVEVIHTLTRSQPPMWQRLQPGGWTSRCWPSGLVEPADGRWPTSAGRRASWSRSRLSRSARIRRSGSTERLARRGSE